MLNKIGILTFHASHNYGSMLQAYALQHFLRGIGQNSEIINLRIDVQKRIYSVPSSTWTWRDWIHIILKKRFYLNRLFKWYKFEFFIRHQLNVTNKEYKSWQEILQDLPLLKYDAIIVGGDQIWNRACGDWDIAYLLPTELNNIKKIAYSPSLGPIMSRFQNSETKDLLYKYLKDFDYISVRDMDGADYVSELLGEKIKTVIDPTMLLKVEDYISFIGNKPLIYGSYILYYSPFPNKDVEEVALEHAYKKKTRIVTTIALDNNVKDFFLYENVGPKEFLNILYYADEIIGQSYHLLVFALLFHKEFYILGDSKDSRIDGLLKTLGIVDRFINISNRTQNNIQPIDYKSVESCIEQKRAESISYLKDALGR